MDLGKWTSYHAHTLTQMLKQLFFENTVVCTQTKAVISSEKGSGDSL